MYVPNLIQERQAAVECDFRVLGVDSFQACLTGVVTLEGVWAEHCDMEQLTLLGCARNAVQLYDQSLERGLMSAFLKLKYPLVELEVEIHTTEARGWGKCVWYKNHANYMQPLHEFAQESGHLSGLHYAMFRTEHAGDQHFRLYSSELFVGGAPMLHESVIYHKVVFALPEGESTMDFNARVGFSPFQKEGMLDFPA